MTARWFAAGRGATLTTMSSRRRTATILFTDVVGSTELLATLGDAGEGERHRHLAQLRGALAMHHGVEVKALGDGLMAVFDSASDALACAATMQRAAAWRASGAAHPFTIRIGISTGDTTVHDGDYDGNVVVEASRLCALAAAGQILATDAVPLMAGAARAQLTRPVGEIPLKGSPTPVPVVEVDWTADEAGMLRVALADDAVLLRQGIAELLVNEAFDVVLQTGDADTLLAQLDAARPHVVVVDVRMPPTFTTEGLEAARRIRSTHPEIGLLVLTQALERVAARQLVDGSRGGVGYLLKERVTDPRELADAIRTIARGGSVVDPELGPLT